MGEPSDPLLRREPIEGELTAAGIAADTRRLTLAGARALAMRGFVVRGVSFLANLALIRLLVPADLGLAAIGAAFVSFAAFVGDGGFTASLIRRTSAPTSRELAVARNVQLTLAIVACLGSLTFLPLYGSRTLVVTGFLVTLPVIALRAPILVSAEREMDFRPLARSEILQAAIYPVIAIPLAAAGLGVCALVIAAIARACAGTAWLIWRYPHPLPRAWNLREATRMFRSGLGYQAISLALLVRDELANLMIVAVGSLRVLGFFNLAATVLQVPGLLLDSVFRVSYPAFARLLRSGGDLPAAAKRMMMTTGIVTAVLVAFICGFAPQGLPWVLGGRWQDASPTVCYYALAVLVVAPLGVSASGILQATGKPMRLAAAIGANAVMLLAALAVLVPPYGAAGAGLAYLLGGCLESLFLCVALRGILPLRLFAHEAVAMLGSVAVAVASYIVAIRLPDGPVGGISGAVIGAGASTLLLAAVAPAGCREVIGVVRATASSR